MFSNKISINWKLDSVNNDEPVIKEKVADSMTKYEKEKAIHDYIVANTAYGVPVEDSTAPVYGVEGVLLDHSAVCQGYAETMKLFMDMLGIECHVVTGTGSSKDGSEPHAWNLIQLDDNEWYHMDATWNDPTPDEAGRINYNYFNLTDAMIQKDHTIDSNRTYPVANGTKYFYYANSQASSYEEFDAIVDKLLKSENLSGEIFLSFNSDINTLTDRIGKAAGNNGINGEIKTQFDGAVITFSIEKK